MAALKEESQETKQDLDSKPDKNVVNNSEKFQSIKVVFLDVDGVLNELRLYDDDESDNDESRDKASGLSIPHLQRIKTIIDKTDCYIVLSTTWRTCQEMKTALFNAMQLKKVGIDLKKRYIGDTPNLGITSKRANEIKQWLETAHKHQYNVIQWTAIDDLKLDFYDQDKEFFNGHFVHIDGGLGITDDDMKAAIKILNAN